MFLALIGIKRNLNERRDLCVRNWLTTWSKFKMMDQQQFSEIPAGLEWLSNKPNTIRYHLENPDVDLVSYMRKRRLAFGEQVTQKRRIYLDTRYWIFIRDVFLGRKQKPIHAEIVEELKRLCSDGSTICPISYSIFAELLLQSDDSTRIAMGKMIDLLSDGCTIQPPHELFKREVYHFITKHTQPTETLIPVSHFAWTKATFVLGDVFPSSDELDPEVMLAIQKSMDDLLWSVGLTEMLQHLPATDDAEKQMTQTVTEEMTDAKFAAAKSDDTFDSLFLDEVTGLLQGYGEFGGGLMTYLAQEAGVSSPAGDATTALEGRMLGQVIRLAFEHKKITTELPSIEIPSGLYAVVRLSPTRKYKKGDFEDFRHATQALPYFDVFLTESSLKHTLTNTPLHFDQKYDCKVISSEEDALKYLRNLED